MVALSRNLCILLHTAPQSKPALTPKQARFVAEYLVDLNATQAAIRTGYSAKTAKQQGSRLLTNAVISAAITTSTRQQLTTTELSAARVLEEYRRLAFVDARSFWDAHGNVKPMSELTAEQGSALAGFEALIKNAKAGDGITDTIHKFKLWDKTKALDSLAKHFGLLKDTIDVQGGMTITWQD